MIDESTFLAGVIVAILLFGVVLFFLGELLAAGVAFLGASLAIYLRETRTKAS